MAYMGEIFQLGLCQFFLEPDLIRLPYLVQIIEHDGVEDQNREGYIGTVCPPCLVPCRLFIDTELCDIVFPVTIFVCGTHSESMVSLRDFVVES